MKLGIGILLGLMVFSANFSYAEESKIGTKDPNTVILNIQSDIPPSASAEKVEPMHPFFAESPANEVMVKVEELDQRIKHLEGLILQEEGGDVMLRSGGKLTIESQGDIEVTTPGTVQFKAKKVDMPSQQKD